LRTQTALVPTEVERGLQSLQQQVLELRRTLDDERRRHRKVIRDYELLKAQHLGSVDVRSVFWSQLVESGDAAGASRGAARRRSGQQASDEFV
jgi:hypothetical protein